jgi:hypothetical protein
VRLNLAQLRLQETIPPLLHQLAAMLEATHFALGVGERVRSGVADEVGLEVVGLDQGEETLACVARNLHRDFTERVICVRLVAVAASAKTGTERPR